MDDKTRVAFLKCFLIAILGGGLFGYTTGMIAGILEPIISELSLSTTETSMLASSLLFGAFIGCLTSGYLGDNFGYTTTIKVCASLYVTGLALSFFCVDKYTFAFSRLLTGLAVGMGSVVIPIFLAKVSADQHRGKWVIINVASITAGILISYFICLGLDINNWRYSFLLPFASALLLWLVSLNLVQVRENQDSKLSLISFFHDLKDKQHLRKIFAVGIVMAMLQQSCGINVYLYYGPKLLSMISSNAQSSMIIIIACGAANMLMTLIAMLFVDKLGRRPVLLIGLVCMIASQFISIISISSDNFYMVCLSLILFVAAFAFSLGGLFWLIVAEVFPAKYKATMMGLASSMNWLTNTIVISSFLPLVDYLGLLGTMTIYLLNTLLALIFCYNVIPETRRVPLSIIESNLSSGVRLKELGRV